MGRAEVHGSSSGGGTSSLGYLLGGDSYSPSSRPPTRPTYDSYEEEAAPQPSPHHQQQRQQQPVMLSAQHGQVEYYADAGEALGWAGSDDVTVGQVRGFTYTPQPPPIHSAPNSLAKRIE